jgi:Fe-S-cluster-containing dehydrogenase component
MTQEHKIQWHLDGPRLRRRDALGLMAASMALASAGCSRQPTERIHPWVNMPEARADGSPVYYATAVVRDGFALGVLVSTYDGRPIKVEGNALHPSSLGATDVFAQAEVLQLWDPDRSQAVTKRLGQDRMGPAAASNWSAFENDWRAVATALGTANGEGLRILCGPTTSPTLRAQLDALLRRWPGARWHQYSAVPAAESRGTHPVYRFDRASCVLALGGDPFSDGPGAVRHAMDWSRRRADGARPRQFAVEVAPGLFGARADRRIALPPHEIDAMAARLAAGKPAPGFEAQAFAALQAAGPQGLAVPGPALSEANHALVHTMNEKLGAMGNTVDLLDSPAWGANAGSLRELVPDMDAGHVKSLLILDANPAYDAPGELGFLDALGKVAHSVHCGLYRDETAQACTWHLPLSHAFEQWSDALAHDGTSTIMQPAIAPLYDSRSLHEILALLTGDDERAGHAIVQRHWRSGRSADFETFWRDALRKGLVEGSAPKPGRTQGPNPPPAAAGAARREGLVAMFVADASTHDGRFANNGWLQELPRPFTKHTWDNAIFMGLETAARAGLATGDVVRVSTGGRHIEGPVWALREHAEDVVTIPLGYGRTQAGRVGNGVGFDAYALMAGGRGPLRIELKRTGRTHDYAVTQHTLDPSGRDPARSVAQGERTEPEQEQPSLYAEWTYPEHAWAMSIDLDACIGCNACTIACQAENNIPIVGKEQVARGREMHWIRVDRYDAPELDNSIFQPLPCMQCEKAPCELVCPVGATMHDSEGINVQVYNRCVGTRFCSNNCPYKVRRFNFLQFTDETSESLKGQRNPNVTVRERGVMEKCNYCLQRVARARQHSERTGVPLVDGDVVTACQSVCPTRAIHFGDLRDPSSDIARLRQSPRHYTLLGELNTRPRTTYLARLRPADGKKGERS